MAPLLNDFIHLWHTTNGFDLSSHDVKDGEQGLYFKFNTNYKYATSKPSTVPQPNLAQRVP